MGTYLETPISDRRSRLTTLRPGPDGAGMTNTIDRYVGNAYLDSISLPGTGGFDSSMSIRLLELPIVTSASVPDNGTGVNPNILSSTSLPEIDRTWGVSVDCTGADPTKSVLIRIGFLGTFGVPVMSGFGELIILPNQGQGFVLPHNGGVVNFQASIPKVANLERVAAVFDESLVWLLISRDNTMGVDN